MAGSRLPSWALASALVLAQVIAVAAAAASAGCGTVDADTDYIAGISYNQVANIHGVAACCDLCTVDRMCKAWTWGLQYPNDRHNSMCYLKTQAPLAGQPGLKMRSPGVFSGLPGNRDKLTAAPTSTAPPTLAPVTIVPFALPGWMLATAAPLAVEVAPLVANSSWAESSSAASSTAAPSKAARFKAAPSAVEHTTAAPVLVPPTLPPLPTAAPPTAAPTTTTPTTLAPTTTTPTTLAPTTTTPTTLAPTTTTPTTLAPTTTTPTTAAPTTTTPTTAAPSTTTPRVATTTARVPNRTQAEASRGSGDCESMEPDVDYLAGEAVGTKFNASSADVCCDACSKAENCGSWTWGPQNQGDRKPSVCYLKSVAPQPWQKHPKPGSGIVSGLPRRRTEAMDQAALEAKKAREAALKAKKALEAKKAMMAKMQAFGNIPLNAQCGGRGWSGGKCSFGLKCYFVNQWYSQCRKDPSMSAIDAEGLLPGGPSHGCTSIFCFSVVTPGTTEPGLMVQQWKLNAGLFACDDYSIISNVTPAELFPDQVMASKVRVSRIHAQLWAQLAPDPHGQWHALNTPVFIKAWENILAEGKYKQHDWTLKLDVDAVIAPPRVKALLCNRQRQGDRFAPMYLLNAVDDCVGNFLHGPVEVLSQAAVDAYGNGAGRCKTQVDYSHNGEDWYLNACLQMLQVPGIKELQLLQDAYMWNGKEVECTTQHAVFHPAKTTFRWMNCVKQIGQDAVAPLPQVSNQEAAFVMKYDTPQALGVLRDGFAARQWVIFSVAVLASLVAVGLLLAAALQRRTLHARHVTVAVNESSGHYRSVSSLLGQEQTSLLE